MEKKQIRDITSTNYVSGKHSKNLSSLMNRKFDTSEKLQQYLGYNKKIKAKISEIYDSKSSIKTKLQFNEAVNKMFKLITEICVADEIAPEQYMTTGYTYIVNEVCSYITENKKSKLLEVNDKFANKVKKIKQLYLEFKKNPTKSNALLVEHFIDVLSRKLLEIDSILLHEQNVAAGIPAYEGPAEKQPNNKQQQPNNNQQQNTNNQQQPNNNQQKNTNNQPVQETDMNQTGNQDISAIDMSQDIVEILTALRNQILVCNQESEIEDVMFCEIKAFNEAIGLLNDLANNCNQSNECVNNISYFINSLDEIRKDLLNNLNSKIKE